MNTIKSSTISNYANLLKVSDKFSKITSGLILNKL